MSRRFGRNQKRHMREALAAEVQRVEEAKQLAAQRLGAWHSAMREVDELRAFFLEVASRVGRESSLVPDGAGEVDLDHPKVQQFMAYVPGEFSYTPLDWSVPTREAVKTEIMERLEVKAVRDVFAHQIIVNCYLFGQQVGIALSHSFLRRGTEQEITNRVAKDLAKHLVRAIKEAQ